MAITSRSLSIRPGSVPEFVAVIEIPISSVITVFPSYFDVRTLLSHAKSRANGARAHWLICESQPQMQGSFRRRLEYQKIGKRLLPVQAAYGLPRSGALVETSTSLRIGPGFTRKGGTLSVV